MPTLFNDYSVIPLNILNGILNWYAKDSNFIALMQKCEIIGTQYGVDPDYLTQVIHDRCYL